MAKSTILELKAAVKKLQSERQERVEEVARIDAMFKELGISPPAARRRRKPATRKAKAKKVVKKAPKKAVKRSKRGTYKKTAEEFVLGLLAGGKQLTTAQIGAKWRQARRGGKSDNTIAKLIKKKKVTRQKLKGARGSMYQKA